LALSCNAQVTAVPCDSRYISRCATAIANECFNHEISSDQWVLIYNRAVKVLTEQRAEMIAGESTQTFIHDVFVAVMVVLLSLVVIHLFGGVR